MDIFLSVLKTKYAQFEGRARRKEFWMFYLFQILSYLVAMLVMFTLSSLGDIFAGIGLFVYVGVAIALVIPSLAVTVRRLHDVNKSGWMIFIGLIPLIGFILMLVWLCTEGTRGPNQYGPDPKGGDEIGDINKSELV